MKRVLFFIILLSGFSVIYSCKEMLDEDGDPLLDVNNNQGLNGARALFRESTDNDTIAIYQYNGLLLSRVITDSASVTDVMYSGNTVSRINFNGFLDTNNDGHLEKDSISYTQLFTYGADGKISEISENRSVFRRADPTPPALIGPSQLFQKTKSLYKLKYNASTNKLDSIIMKDGVEVAGTLFAYSNYSKTGYKYQGDNVSEVTRSYGALNGNVQEAPTSIIGYTYSDYDTKINPYTLLPFAYKVSLLLSTKMNDIKSMVLSPNSPQRMSFTDLTQPIPVPVILSTNYSYDSQTYVTKGFGIYYSYKPL